MKRGLLIVTLFSVLLIAAACGGGSDENKESPTSAPAATEVAVREAPVANPVEAKPTDTTVPAKATPVPAEATTVAEPPTVEPEPTLTDEQLKAIEKLDSYRAVTSWTSKGTDAEGKPIDDSAEISIEYTKEPLARSMSMAIDSTSELTSTKQSFDIYQIDKDMYMNAGADVGWIRIQQDQSPFDDPSISLMTGGQLFSNLEDLKRVRPDEKINGIDSRHYTFDEQVLGKLIGEATGDVKADGDVWIAKDGGYVTKYVLAIEVKGGNAGMLDPNMAEGTFSMAWELRDVNNKDIKIELPAEAKAGTSLAGFDGDFPTPEGATVNASSASFVIVQTDLPVEDAAKFYEEALTKLGWTKDDSNSGGFGGMSSLSFTKDGVQLSVLINKDEASGKTQIMANAQQPE
jgi:hypothetical protein